LPRLPRRRDGPGRKMEEPNFAPGNSRAASVRARASAARELAAMAPAHWRLEHRRSNLVLRGDQQRIALALDARENHGKSMVCSSSGMPDFPCEPGLLWVFSIGNILKLDAENPVHLQKTVDQLKIHRNSGRKAALPISTNRAYHTKRKVHSIKHNYVCHNLCGVKPCLNPAHTNAVHWAS
jgi:hypothetical protein